MVEIDTYEMTHEIRAPATGILSEVMVKDGGTSNPAHYWVRLVRCKSRTCDADAPSCCSILKDQRIRSQAAPQGDQAPPERQVRSFATPAYMSPEALGSDRPSRQASSNR